MSYLDAIDATLRRHLIDNASLSAMIGARVYPTYLAKVKNPIYPCICFSRSTSPRDYRYRTRVSPVYEVWIYSTKDYSETDRIFEYLTLILDNEFFPVVGDTDSRAGFKILDHGSQDMDPDEQLYMSNFRVQAFGFFT